MKNLIYLGLIFILGCNQPDPITEYLKTSHISICKERIKLGEKVNPETLNLQNVTYKKEIDTYYITCDDGGIMFVGTGDHSQLFHIKEASFNISHDSTVNDIMGLWIPGEETGPDNDLAKARYEVEQALGKPSTIRPITWEKDNIKLIFASQRLEFGTVEYVKSIMRKDP